MKRRNWRSVLLAMALALLAVAGSVGCMISGLELENVIWWHLAVSWLLAAAVFSLCFACRVELYPLTGLALLGVYLWYKGPLRQSVKLLICSVSRIYRSAYGWPVLFAEDYTGISVTTALCWLGVLVVVGVTYAVIRRKGIVPAIAAVALPAVSCLVVTDTVPGESWLFLLLLALWLLLLSWETRKRQEDAGNRLLLLLALPAALALLVLFSFVPREGYQMDSLPEKMEAWVTEKLHSIAFPQPSQPPALPQLPQQEQVAYSDTVVGLRSVGPRPWSEETVMTVTAAKGGPMYLRGMAYETYTGSTWKTPQGGDPAPAWPDSGALTEAGELRIETVAVHDVLYMPYYPADEGWYRSVKNGGIPNTLRQKSYSVAQASAAPGAGAQADLSLCLQLPQDTLAWAAPLAESIGGSLPVGSRLVNAIADYVRNSAEYDLNTGRMPVTRTDFARWFLEESDTGYCVHFASSAAVLLRAAGIPARYVTGYMFSGTAGLPVEVKAYQSHAWVEYCLPGGVWQVLEATPAAELPVPTEPAQTETTPTTETESAQTQPSQTLPTSPEETREPVSTQPGKQEQPSQARKLPKGLLWTLAILALALLQWRLRAALRARYLRSARGNTLALRLWREIVWEARLLGIQPEKQLLSLAQKAKFSQHTLTPDEIRILRDALTDYRKTLRQKNVLHQILYTLLLAIY